MTYSYECEKCDVKFDISKSMSDSSRLENCPNCGIVANRIFSPPQFIGTSVYEANFNPGLGKVVKSQREVDEHCKRSGLVEVGNENPAKHITPPSIDWSDV